MLSYTLGLDLAQKQDYTALIALYRAVPIVPDERARYEVRGIHRYERGTDYPAIVADVLTRLRAPPLAHDVQLVLDGTGVGAPVVDMFRRVPNRPCRIIPVLITAGNRATREDDGYWHVPKRDLVSAVQVLLQEDRLKIAAHPLRSVLHNELQNFQVKITASAHDTYGAWREGQHDDLVLALALACWYAERRKPFVSL